MIIYKKIRSIFSKTSSQFILFSCLSLFSASLVEIFSVLDIFKETGSLSTALGLIVIQMVVEVILNVKLPSLLTRFGPGKLILTSLPLRIMAFILLIWKASDLIVLICAGSLLGLSAALSDVPRGVILSWWSKSDQRGKLLSIFETIRYGALVAAPLIGGIAFDFGGFVSVAIISIISGIGSAILAMILWNKLNPTRYKISTESKAEEIAKLSIQIPVQVRFLWWSTGLRYIAESAFYPLFALTLYGNTISVGSIAAISMFVTLAFGFIMDKISPKFIILLATIFLIIGWTPRIFNIPIIFALITSVFTAIGGKIAGTFEKKVTFDFGDKYGNPPSLASRRETELLIIRIFVLLVQIIFQLFISNMLVISIVMMLLLSTLSVIITTFKPIVNEQSS